MIGTAPRIDAHLHLWDLTVGRYSWLGPQHGALFSSFTAEQARAELDTAGIDSAILVQAEDSTGDTEFLLDTAAKHPWIIGVVGWVPLDDPASAGRELDRLQQNPVFRGVRHLVHDDPRDDFLELPEVRRSLALVAERDLSFDIPDAWPRHLGAVDELAAALPGLTIVVDHLAKPPLGTPTFASWREQLARVAAHENTVAKVSGLRSPGVAYSTETVRPAWESALEFFGTGRLMYGGDWPMSVPVGGYQPTWGVLAELIGELSPDEQASLLSGTATATYRLGSAHGK